MYQSFCKRQILDSSKLKEFEGDKFEFNENGRKFSKWVENTVGKGEIACYKQFLLFPQCFQEGKLNVAKIMISVIDSVENIVGKGENAGYQHFLLFLQCFQMASLSGTLKYRITWERVNSLPN